MTARTASLLLALAAACGSSTTPALEDGAADGSDDPGASEGAQDGAEDDLPRDGASDPSDGASGAADGPRATFRTTVAPHYLSVREGGVEATSDAAGERETFTVEDLNGGELASGDAVTLRGAGGYLSAADGGGAALAADVTVRGANETFTILRSAGDGAVHTGDEVSLQTHDGLHYVSASGGGGGGVRADAPWARGWERFTITLEGEPPPTSDARAAKERLLAYFGSISGTHTLAGVENKSATMPDGHTEELAGLAKRTPAFWGADFGFGSGAVDHRAEVIAEAKRQWDAGAVVALMYHTCVPTRDEYCEWDDVGGAHPVHLSDAEWEALFTEGTGVHAEWRRRLDILAEYFAELKDAGVAPLFRPFHEMNQCAFWWSCKQGENGSVKLWKTTREYLVNQKGLDNIVWVWNVQDFESLGSDVDTYHPGTDQFDLATLDIYNTGYTQQNYDAIRRAAGGKPIGIGECQFLPSEATLAGQPAWTFFMLWPDFLYEPRNLEVYEGLFASERVVTREEMPGWR